MNVTPKKFHIFLIITFSFLFLSYLSLQVHAFVKSPDLEILTIDVINNKAVIRGQSSKHSRIFINGQEILVEEDGFFEQAIDLSGGDNVLTFKVISRIGKKSYVTKTINRDHYL